MIFTLVRILYQIVKTVGDSVLRKSTKLRIKYISLGIGHRVIKVFWQFVTIIKMSHQIKANICTKIERKIFLKNM